MVIALFMATAFGGPVRHVVHVELDVPTPTRSADDPQPAGRGEAEAMALPDVRAPQWADQKGDVAFACSSQVDGTGDFVPAYDNHRPRLFLRNGVVWFERQAIQYPRALEEWPALTCVWEGKGRRVEYVASWSVMTEADLACAESHISSVPGGPGTLEDFQGELTSGEDANGVLLGYLPFNDEDSTVAFTTTTAHPRRSGEARGNAVLQLDLDVERFAGIVHNFRGASGDEWTPRDYSSVEAVSFWIYGRNTGNAMYFHIIDNRQPCSTTDDAERFTFPFVDDFEGWRQMKVPFTDFDHLDIERDTPNDGLTRSRIHGWALGVAFDSKGPQTYFIDDIELHSSESE